MKTENKRFEDLLKKIREENKEKRINIRVRKNKYAYTVYLDYFRNGKHDYYFFSNAQKLIGKPESIQDDIELIDHIRNFRNIKEREIKDNPDKLSLSFESKDSDFMAYYDDIQKKNQRPQYQGAYRHLKIFFNERPVRFSELNYKVFEQFKEYIMKEVGVNTAAGYLVITRAVLNKAIRDKIIKENPMKDVRIKSVDSDIEFLDEKDLQKVIKTQTKLIEIKNAFLFSCFTGLRRSDMFALTFDRIRDNMLKFRQKKTDKEEYLPLNADALKIINEQRKRHPDSDKVFHFKSIPGMQYSLSKFLKEAKIEKSIHYHCSRHTFAVRCLNNGIGIYQVSKFLGHANIKATQVYVKFVTEEKRKEMDKLPNLM